MNVNQKLLAAAVVILSLIFLIGCEKEGSTGPGGKTQLPAPSNLQAYSADETTVGLQWTLSSDETITEFDDYMIDVKTLSGTVVGTYYESKGVNNILISGLTQGTVYVFELSAEVIEDASDYENSSVVSIKWSPASRFTGEKGNLPIKVYETSSSGAFGSGLILFDPSSSKPKIVSVSSPGADASLIDLVLYTSGTSNVSLRSASIYNGTWKLTRFSSINRNANSLDDPRISPPDTTTYLAGNTAMQIDSVAVSTSRIYYFKGDNGNYGRILVQRNAANGTLLWGTTPEQYLNLIISYQSVAYNPYSKTGSGK